MKPITPFLLIAALTACGQSEAPPSRTQPAAIPTVDELATDPERLKTLRRQCKTERPTIGDVLCNRVAEATNNRFFGDGKVSYTPSETPPTF